EQAAWAAQWQAATERALQAGDWQQALQAAQRWRQFAPEDAAAAASVVAATEALRRARSELDSPLVEAAPEPVVEKVTFETPVETAASVAAGMESAATTPAISPGWMPEEPATTATEEPLPEVVTPEPSIGARLRDNPRLLGMALVGLLVVGAAIALLANNLSGGGEEETPVAEGQTVTAALGESYD